MSVRFDLLHTIIIAVTTYIWYHTPVQEDFPRAKPSYLLPSNPVIFMACLSPINCLLQIFLRSVLREIKKRRQNSMDSVSWMVILALVILDMRSKSSH